MIKSELVLRLTERLRRDPARRELYQRDVETVVNAVLEGIAGAMVRGDRVELRGFGTFSVKRRDARQGRNPRTGDAVAVAEKGVPYFKTGKEMRERLNRDEAPKPPRAKKAAKEAADASPDAAAPAAPARAARG